tara:strand:- start:316 stop:483 length:168 start_codon:yes stop_codon:yes gene_type:complete
MTYVITFIFGFTIGFMFKHLLELDTDKSLDDDDYYVSITEKGKQWLKDHDEETKQ